MDSPQTINPESKNNKTVVQNPSTIEPEQWKWKMLTIDEISVSFEVVSSLKQNTKMDIVNEKFLAADNSYAIFRYIKGNSRKKTTSFMKHLLAETKHCTDSIKNDIKDGINIDENISKFSGIIYKLSTFLGAYHYVVDIYEKSSLDHAELELIREQFKEYLLVLIRGFIIK